MSVYFYISTEKTGKNRTDSGSLPKARLPESVNKELVLKGTNDCAILFVHGLTGTPREMLPAAKLLNRKGYTIFCPTLANHGGPIDILKRTTWQECYSSVRDAFISLEESKTYKYIFTSGISVGALLALLLADEFKEKISAVSCLSPTLFYDGWNTPWSKYILPLGYYTFLKYIAYFKEEPPYGIKHPALRKRIHEYYSKAKISDIEEAKEHGYPYMPVSLFYQNHLLAKHLIKRLPNITVPVQLIQSDNDDLTSVKNSKTIHDKISSKTKELILLHDSYHLITVDQERDKVADNMDRFFQLTLGKSKDLPRVNVR